MDKDNIKYIRCRFNGIIIIRKKVTGYDENKSVCIRTCIIYIYV